MVLLVIYKVLLTHFIIQQILFLRGLHLLSHFIVDFLILVEKDKQYIGGLGVFLVAANLTFIPVPIVWLLAIFGAFLFGAAWAFIPAYLQATRGSHVVITTIMFNFIASSLMIFLLVDVIRDTNQMAPHTIKLPKELWFPSFEAFSGILGIKIRYSPLNLTFLLAIAALFFVWFLVWKTRWGYEMLSLIHI